MKRWSKLKATLESFFTDKIRGRVQLHTTAYRRPGRFDDEGRAWISIGGQEVINMPLDTVYFLSRSDSEQNAQFEQKSILDQSRLAKAACAYSTLAINEILESDDSLVRALGMLDKRLGKRRLAKLDVSVEPPLVQYLYLFRCEVDNVTPTIPDKRQDLHADLGKRQAVQRH